MMKSKMIGITEKQNNNGWYAVSLHYSADKDKRPTSPDALLLVETMKKNSADKIVGQLRKNILTDPNSTVADRWIAEISRNMNTPQWRQEQEMDVNIYLGNPVFPSFRKEVHIGRLSPEIDYDFPILVGLDFGFHRPAMIISQWNGRTWKWLQEWTPYNIKTPDFATGVFRRVELYTHQGFRVKYYCGLEAKQINQQTGLTNAQVFNEYGMPIIIIENTSIPRRLHIVRMLLKAWEDGVPALMIDEDMTTCIDAFSGAYRYPEKKEEKPEDERPYKDGIYDHPMDAGQYIAEQCFNTKGEYHYTEEQESLITSDLAWANKFQPDRVFTHRGIRGRSRNKFDWRRG